MSDDEVCENRRTKSRASLTGVNVFLPVLGTIGVRGGVVVKALRYKLAGRGFDSRWCQDSSP